MKRNLATAIFAVAVLSAVTVAARAQNSVNVTVPGNATGGFGNPTYDGAPFVNALAVSGPGTITVSYVSGQVTDCCPDFSTGPNGVTFNFGTAQAPLQEAIGEAGGMVPNTDALIGEFVPQARTLAAGFYPVDGTKDLVRIGLLPANLFLVGTSKVIPVKGAGTLFLGINDNDGNGNGGSFTVSVTFAPAN